MHTIFLRLDKFEQPFRRTFRLFSTRTKRIFDHNLRCA